MNETTASEADIIGVTIPGPMTIYFPKEMFSPAGKLEYRLHRSRFLTQMAETYDALAEKARLTLHEMDPSEDRPPLEKLGMTLVDVSAMAKALTEDEPTEYDDAQ